MKSNSKGGSKRPQKQKSAVQHRLINADDAGQRIDNFLKTFLKGVPKGKIYKMIRTGDVRINKRKVLPSYHLIEGDDLRVPPLYLDQFASAAPPQPKTLDYLRDHILYEDEHLLIINKPAGMSVHAGTTVRIGIIEAFKYLYPHLPNLELAHRLDSDTSGCLILAKKKRILRELHQLMREGKITKLYWALTQGKWKPSEYKVALPLHKSFHKGGKHVVSVKDEGKPSLTLFKPIKTFKEVSLVEATLFTGRTHQIRVHAQAQGHPIAGDDRYGDPEFNKKIRDLGFKRMFLHARSIDFILPSLDQRITVEAPLDAQLEQGLKLFEEG